MGCRWSIGDGSNIKVMHEPWIRGVQEGCLRGPQRQEAYNMTVKDLLLSGIKQWNMRVLCDVFNPLDIHDILQVPLAEDLSEDRLIWKEEQHGAYSVKSGYRVWRKAASNNGNMVVEGYWDKLWKIAAPARVKHLL